ncbi:MAG: hypothetical protein O9312_07130 [Hylemonella sp.]|nr:hypothetical protein [Hylemonella sp.]
MNPAPSVTVDLAGEYPLYKREGEKLVRLEAPDPTHRYSLTTNVQTGETYYIEFTDEEEAQANALKAEWDIRAPEREAEAKRQADEVARFEDSLRYETRIVAFLDILGWKSAIGHGGSDLVKALGKTLAQLQWVANHFNSLSGLLPKDMRWPGNPVMTQFSDSLVISVEDSNQGKEVLQTALLVLTSNLIDPGYLLRGGVTRGEIFHDGNLVFGPGLIQAYDLESKFASTPRVILSRELSVEWEGRDTSGALPWAPSPDGYLFFNFLPPYMGNPFFTDPQLWQKRLSPVRDLILKKARETGCPEDVFAKYVWLAGYFDRVCDEQPQCGVEKVLQLAMKTRWEHRY